jgi:hypothetical protein
MSNGRRNYEGKIRRFQEWSKVAMFIRIYECKKEDPDIQEVGRGKGPNIPGPEST